MISFLCVIEVDIVIFIWPLLYWFRQELYGSWERLRQGKDQFLIFPSVKHTLILFGWLQISWGGHKIFWGLPCHIYNIYLCILPGVNHNNTTDGGGYFEVITNWKSSRFQLCHHWWHCTTSGVDIDDLVFNDITINDCMLTNVVDIIEEYIKH